MYFSDKNKMTLTTQKCKGAQRSTAVLPKNPQEMDPALGTERNERDPVRGTARVVVESIDITEGNKDFAKAEISELSNTYPVIYLFICFIYLFILHVGIGFAWTHGFL